VTGTLRKAIRGPAGPSGHRAERHSGRRPLRRMEGSSRPSSSSA
jgi:hypothetical protein